jgi:hypothetical protein
MSSYLELFANVRRRPSIYVGEARYRTVAAFVEGYDQACHHGVLVGFNEWLLVRLNDACLTNLVWWALVCQAAFPKARDSQTDATADAASERRAIDVLFQLVAEFSEIRNRDGLSNIYAAHEKWRRKHRLPPR